MDKTLSHSSISSLEESEFSIETHDNVEPAIQSSTSAVVTGGIETGGGVDHLAAHFRAF